MNIKNVLCFYLKLFLEQIKDGKFDIHYKEEIKEEKKNLNNEEVQTANDEENEERIKVRKEFNNTIGADFKKIFISYLEKLEK